jgi:hypothetical protein
MVFSMKKYGELCRDKQSFVSSTMYLLFYIVYNHNSPYFFMLKTIVVDYVKE